MSYSSKNIQSRKESFEEQLRSLQSDIASLSEKMLAPVNESSFVQNKDSPNKTFECKTNESINTSSLIVSKAMDCSSEKDEFSNLKHELIVVSKERDKAIDELEMARKEIEELKKSIHNYQHIKAMNDHLRQDNESIRVALDSSEKIRKQQKDLILLLQRSQATLDNISVVSMDTLATDYSSVQRDRSLLGAVKGSKRENDLEIRNDQNIANNNRKLGSSIHSNDNRPPIDTRDRSFSGQSVLSLLSQGSNTISNIPENSWLNSRGYGIAVREPFEPLSIKATNASKTSNIPMTSTTTATKLSSSTSTSISTIGPPSTAAVSSVVVSIASNNKSRKQSEHTNATVVDIKRPSTGLPSTPSSATTAKTSGVRKPLTTSSQLLSTSVDSTRGGNKTRTIMAERNKRLSNAIVHTARSPVPTPATKTKSKSILHNQSQNKSNSNSIVRSADYSPSHQSSTMGPPPNTRRATSAPSSLGNNNNGRYSAQSTRMSQLAQHRMKR